MLNFTKKINRNKKLRSLGANGKHRDSNGAIGRDSNGNNLALRTEQGCYERNKGLLPEVPERLGRTG